MAATFRTRPWLLSSSRPVALPMYLSGPRIYQANIEQTRSRSFKPDSGYKQSMGNARRQRSQQQATSSIIKQMHGADKLQDAGSISMLAPRTIVPLPLVKQPRAPKEFMRYHWEITKQRFVDRLQRLMNSWATKPKWNKKARLRSTNSEIIAAARNLHASMSYCLAKGGPAEKAQLAQICVPKLYRSLLSAIENRPAGKSYTWERIAETDKLWWPKVVDNKWTETDVGFKLSFRQAVVGIKSKQRLTELNARGQKVSEKDMELLEYIVLWRQVDPVNMTQTDWQIYGTLKETTFEDMMEEVEEMNEAQRHMAQKKLDTERRALGARK
ncbi:hypothetical protein N8I77_010475 [Diaporthe amygdali]|uniref:Uncharacterized protein n=1 Tax=Phomopsis amygdali TaxID=1214568 RepID=A0AAD9S739_PHOAM|nr:hypothetical protein N8I77_010475 [Diaporthe amygdali]